MRPETHTFICNHFNPRVNAATGAVNSALSCMDKMVNPLSVMLFVTGIPAGITVTKSTTNSQRAKHIFRVYRIKFGLPWDQVPKWNHQNYTLKYYAEILNMKYYPPAVFQYILYPFVHAATDTKRYLLLHAQGG